METPTIATMKTQRRTTLADAVHGAAHPSASVPERTAGALGPTPEPRRRAASRAGKRGVLIHVEPETLKLLGLEQDRILQALGLEALNTLLEKYENPQ